MTLFNFEPLPWKFPLHFAKKKITQKFLLFSSSNCSRPLGLERIGNMQCSTLNNNRKEILTTPVWNLSLPIISIFIHFHLWNINSIFSTIMQFCQFYSILSVFIPFSSNSSNFINCYPYLFDSLLSKTIHFHPSSFHPFYPESFESSKSYFLSCNTFEMKRQNISAAKTTLMILLWSNFWQQTWYQKAQAVWR